MDKVAIQNLIKDLIEKTMVKVSEITITEDKGSNTWFGVEVNEPRFFIDREGEALQALNHLVRRMIETKDPRPSRTSGKPSEGAEPSFIIDINGFQKKRVENIRSVAHIMSERARYFKSNIEVDPMSSFERRVVHEFLSDAIDLKTESVGFGPTRRVVIKYIGVI